MSTAAESFVIQDDIPGAFPETAGEDSHLRLIPAIPSPRGELNLAESPLAPMEVVPEESPLIDETSIAEAQAGNLDALTGMWLDLEPALRRHATRLVGPNHAEDLMQTTALKVFSKINMYTLGTNFAGWVYRILTNTAFDHYKKEDRHTSVDFSDDITQYYNHEPIFMGRPADPEQTVVTDLSRAEFIRDILAKLPETFKDAIVGIDINGLSYEEYAALSGVKMGTVRSRLHRARALVRDMQQDGKIRVDL